MANITKLNRSKGVTYRIRVGNGYDANDRQIMKSMSWTPEPGMTEKQIQKELNRIVVEFEKKVSDGLVFRTLKFAEFSAIWLSYAEKHLSPKYVLESKRKLEVINSELGHIPLSKLKKQHLQEFYNKLLTEARIVKHKVQDENGKSIIIEEERYKSPATIMHYHKMISTLLTKAAQWDYIEKNICLGKGIELPKKQKYQPHYLQDSDVVRLVELLQDAPIEHKTIIMLLLYSGMRNGEAMGLEWDDIDFDNCLVSINKSSQYLSGIGIITKDTKNASSERVIQVVPELAELLRLYKVWQNEQRLKKGPLWKANPGNTEEKYCDNWNTCSKNGKSVYCGIEKCKDRKDIDRLFTQYNGIPMDPATPRHWLKRFIKKHDLPDFNIHSLRHTNVSLMIMQGVPIPSVARLVGHSSTSTTTRIYSHSIQLAEQIAIEKVADVINPSRKIK